MSNLAITTHAAPTRAGISGATRRGIVTLMATWTRRARGRTQLKHLDAHLLRDIGISESHARAEARRPFWQ